MWILSLSPNKIFSSSKNVQFFKHIIEKYLYRCMCVYIHERWRLSCAGAEGGIQSTESIDEIAVKNWWLKNYNMEEENKKKFQCGAKIGNENVFNEMWNYVKIQIVVNDESIDFFFHHLSSFNNVGLLFVYFLP